MHDLDAEQLQRELGGRAFRLYPALVSTEAAALSWAGHGAPHGAVIAADYQAAPRFREPLPWKIEQGVGLGLSVILRPELLVHQEGALFTAVALAAADCLEDAVVEWPDRILRAGALLALTSVRAEVDGLAIPWAVTTILVRDAPAPRTPLLARLARAVVYRAAADAEACLADYRSRSASLGRRLEVTVLPAGGRVSGTAVDARADGGLVLESDAGRRVTVLPQHVGRVEAATG